MELNLYKHNYSQTCQLLQLYFPNNEKKFESVERFNERYETNS